MPKAERLVIFDTETTGISPKQGHRIIEFGAVAVENGKVVDQYHQFYDPERKVDAGAAKVHGITNDKLDGQPRFTDKIDELQQFIGDSTLVAHNAKFDVGHLNAEFERAGREPLTNQVIDSLQVARDKHPGEKNTLDALSERYGVNNSHRTLHGALLDAELLAEVYHAMEGKELQQTATRKKEVAVDVTKTESALSSRTTNTVDDNNQTIINWLQQAMRDRGDSEAAISAATGRLVARQQEQQAETVSVSKAEIVSQNRQRGEEFESEMAQVMRNAGFQVEEQVAKETPFGKRIIDLEIRDRDGKLLGGIETKTGKARYDSSQQTKDEWLKMEHDYSVQMVRDR